MRAAARARRGWRRRTPRPARRTRSCHARRMSPDPYWRRAPRRGGCATFVAPRSAPPSAPRRLGSTPAPPGRWVSTRPRLPRAAYPARATPVAADLAAARGGRRHCQPPGMSRLQGSCGHPRRHSSLRRPAPHPRPHQPKVPPAARPAGLAGLARRQSGSTSDGSLTERAPACAAPPRLSMPRPSSGCCQALLPHTPTSSTALASLCAASLPRIAAVAGGNARSHDALLRELPHR
mmetsp:Transcript_9295/g.28958  ORF Transcript_9295/g.28958 Transcript_9295/m.28958 type:complete len:235 (-) Transcript_9295:71-775(-)